MLLLQVCRDGLLLGPGPRREAQVPAARSVSHRVPRGAGGLRVKEPLDDVRQLVPYQIEEQTFILYSNLEFL